MKPFAFVFLLLGLLTVGCEVKNGVFLVSDDLQTETITEENAYCGGFAGSVSSTGQYRLESYGQGELADQVDLGFLTLVSETPHDDLHSLPFLIEGRAAYQLNQYESCNSESIRLFTVDDSGKIQAIPFVKNGVQTDSVSTDYTGTVTMNENLFNFCPYNNTEGTEVCDTYRYENGALEYVSTETHALKH